MCWQDALCDPGVVEELFDFNWIQEGFKWGFLQKHLNPIRLPFLGDSVRILGVSPAVTLTFGL